MRFKTPWRVIEEQPGTVLNKGVWRVVDADGELIYHSGTYSGDGDEEIHLSFLDWVDLVAVVNR